MIDKKGFLIRNYIDMKDVDETTPGITQEEYNRIAKTVDNINEMDRFAFNAPRSDRPIDIQWVKGRFNISTNELSDKALMYGKYFSTSSYKYSSSRLGCHLACNTKPQYTRYADIRQSYNPTMKRLPLTTGMTTKDSNIGMGTYFSETIDDNAQLVYLQFGFKKFNGLLDYLMSAIDYGDVVVANTGRQPTFFNVGEVVGAIIAFAMFPITSVIVYGLRFIKNYFPISKAYDYYYMRPAMHVYWATVNQLALQFAMELKLLNPKLEKRQGPDQDTYSLGVNTSIDKRELEEISEILGNDIFDGESGFLDIYAVMAKPQAMYREYLRRKQEQMGEGEDYIKTIDIEGGMTVPPDPNAIYSGALNNIGGSTLQDDLQEAEESFSLLRRFQDFLDNMIKRNPGGTGTADDSAWKPNDLVDALSEAWNTIKDKASDAIDAADQATESIQSSMKDVANKVNQSLDELGEKARTAMSSGFAFDINKYFKTDEADDTLNNWINTFDSVLHEGGQNAIFQVEYTGSVSDSISNSTKEIDIGGSLKSVATGTRNLKFNLAGGNVGLGLNTGELLSAAKETLMGGLSGVTLGFSNVLATIFGDAYVDLPKMWDDSSFDKATVSYTIKLRSPYNNVYSRFQNEVIPLCMLLAGVLPLSTGQASYTSPFLCNLTCQGVQNIKLGMITSLSITRAVTNMPFNKAKQPMGIDVTFSVTDFSNLLTAPVATGIFNKIFGFGMHEDSPIGRWIATACGRDMQTDTYFRDRLSLRMARTEASLKSYFSAYRTASALGFKLSTVVAPFTAQANWNISLKPSDRR